MDKDITNWSAIRFENFESNENSTSLSTKNTIYTYKTNTHTPAHTNTQTHIHTSQLGCYRIGIGKIHYAICTRLESVISNKFSA